ncbi:hypothetical protein FHW12_002963 [Dokdonella fugitiva]|uniref:Uncharacterized protein n=1 Tax=Dokdonella fugitiva TaxID=328517 RepID=A0A839EVW1_9GAMM|nr:hypothetical protein [Dokdonella fugitiva]MBA8888727.1 hypothetical protein [Dokdonella fugitiva]
MGNIEKVLAGIIAFDAARLVDANRALVEAGLVEVDLEPRDDDASCPKHDDLTMYRVLVDRPIGTQAEMFQWVDRVSAVIEPIVGRMHNCMGGTNVRD